MIFFMLIRSYLNVEIHSKIAEILVPIIKFVIYLRNCMVFAPSLIALPKILLQLNKQNSE
ncbi:hypothetical protein MmazTMA_13960 [Methanosarcina mazei]|nr:hypothetical protein MmazTMA_13960 [Methanosarcina mazei]